MCVCHLQDVLGRPQAYVFQPLAVLLDAGVVTDRRDGLFVLLRLADQEAERLLAQTTAPACRSTAGVRCPCRHCKSQSG
jgi:DNA-binding transcriptional ArsR family regulator